MKVDYLSKIPGAVGMRVDLSVRLFDYNGYPFSMIAKLGNPTDPEQWYIDWERGQIKQLRDTSYSSRSMFVLLEHEHNYEQHGSGI